MKGSRGQANLVTKCKMCSRDSSLGNYFRHVHNIETLTVETVIII